MPKLDLSKIETRTGSSYPGGLNDKVAGRSTQRFGDAGGITQYGVNLVHLAPGGLSSLRHYHMEQDEFLMVTTGVCTLIDDTGEQQLLPGDCAAFPAGDPNGHQIANKTDAPAAFLVVGTHTPMETAFYSDMD
ncbi:MAG: putative cupin superfamily protein [Paracoccaceae bacterium]|jgi:uncharacterized cupin superfamily protein